jgi:hypothetical protein
MWHGAQKDWKPMSLAYVGQVAELMRGSTGSLVDPQNRGKKA